MRKPQLRPILVPWMISPSISDLQLRTRETEPVVQVILNAFFKYGLVPETGLRNSELPHYSKSQPHLPRADTDFLVLLEFHFVRVAIDHSSFSPRSVIDVDAFDRSLIPVTRDNKSEAAALDYLQRINEFWMTTGVPVDPGMYEVLGISDNQEHEKSRHYLIRGHDRYIEVRAEEWNWSVIDKQDTSRYIDTSTIGKVARGT